ncbi:family 20 glycosylhydrolase [Parapedobacter sp. 2B3]|uniref:family 20 glycosylhydrolase n=1 Tax=Parapedobacter sp. 2B3 TaxID=3342381 RepID=UPI0035B69F7F
MNTRYHITALLVLFACHLAVGQSELAVRGFCIAAPSPERLNDFVRFIDEELAPRGINTLVLRVDHNYAFESRPELRGDNPLSQREVKQLVAICRKHHIRIIPQINLLGHQSWAGQVGKLLEVYPQFDETPHVQMPEAYAWPNPDGLYCKSYCPLHPDVHEVVFDLVDEICEVFEADAFHAGMDEVFYIGHDSCARCAGHDKAELFANEVNKISSHLAQHDRQLWIWGDRLIDGKTTGIGMWEASMNNTHRAVDLIGKDVMVCDWHYDQPVQTAVYFAMKGFSVVTCPWRKGEVATAQLQDMIRFKQYATDEMAPRYQGMMQTVWRGAGAFLDEFYSEEPASEESEVTCFKALFPLQ